jgi:putative SOS response-associated peptidase YedK
MCNLYSLTKGQAAIVALVRAMRDRAGNLPPMPGIFPDYPAWASRPAQDADARLRVSGTGEPGAKRKVHAAIVRNAPDGVRELAMARWGMPGPPQFGGAPITNIRNVKSPHWRRWLQPASSKNADVVRAERVVCVSVLAKRRERHDAPLVSVL